MIHSANVSAADRAKQYKKSKVFEGAHNWQKVHAKSLKSLRIICKIFAHNSTNPSFKDVVHFLYFKRR